MGSESVLVSLTKGLKVWEAAVGTGFNPDQVLLSMKFRSRPDCRTAVLTKEFWGWGGDDNLILKAVQDGVIWSIPIPTGKDTCAFFCFKA